MKVFNEEKRHWHSPLSLKVVSHEEKRGVDDNCLQREDRSKKKSSTFYALGVCVFLGQHQVGARMGNMRAQLAVIELNKNNLHPESLSNLTK